MSVLPIQIIQARKLLGLSQKDLAAKIGVTHARVSEWEREKDRRPERSKEIIKALRDAGIQFMDSEEYIGVMVRKDKIKRITTS